MNEREFLLTQFASECMEVAHRVTKALQFGIDEIQPGQPLTNGERTTEEIYDLVATMDMLVERDILPRPDLAVANEKYIVKKEKVARYMAFALGRSPHSDK